MTASLSTLRTRAKRRADMESSTFVADAEWLQYINEGLAELHEIVVNKSEDFLVTSYPVPVVAGTAAYALPTAFGRERGVDVTSGGNTYSMRPFMFAERNRYVGFAGEPTYVDGLGYQYQIVGANIRFIPTPTASLTVTLWYVPQVTELSADGDTINVAYALGWERYVVLYAAIKALQKEEGDVTEMMIELQGLARKIEMNAKRHDGEPRRVVDMRYRHRGGY